MLTVTHTLRDFENDQKSLARQADKDMRSTVREGLRVGNDVAKTSAKRTAGAHGKHYHRAFTYEMHAAFHGFGSSHYSGEYGPDISKPQGEMSFERGSRNQPPHLDLAKSADLIGPSFAQESADSRRMVLVSAEAEHLAAVVAAINSQNGAAYSLGELTKMSPTSLPSSYNEVHVLERLGDGPRRSSEPSEVHQWRVLTRAVAQSYSNAQEMRRRAAAALLGKSLTVDGQQTTECERTATDDPIAPDDGWFSGASEFGYAL